MKKFYYRTVLLGITAIMITGCGARSSGATDSAKAENAVNFWHSMSGVAAEATEKLISDFNSGIGSEKGIAVTGVFSGYEVLEKLNAVAQANDTKNFPDAAQMYSSGLANVSKMKPYVSIDELFSRPGNRLSKNDLEPSFIRAFTYQNTLVGIPFNGSTILLYYNKNMFQAAGLNPQSPPKTIAEMAEIIKKLTVFKGKEVERYGLNVAVKRYQLCNWIGGQGQYNFIGDQEGGRAAPMTKVTFGEDGTLRKFLGEWQKVINTGGYKFREDNINEEFASQIFGMAIMSSARIGTITNLSKDKFEFAVAPLPKVDSADTGGISVGGGSICVFRRDEQKLDGIWEFVQYAVSPEAQMQYHRITGYIPVNHKVYELPEMKAHLSANPLYQVAIDQLHASHPNVQEPIDIIGYEIDDIITSAMLDFAEGKKTLDETHDIIVNGCNEKLAAYHKANS
jgi:sn-glycerol 3-phosphate transport system substrate-binding protein